MHVMKVFLLSGGINPLILSFQHYVRVSGLLHSVLILHPVGELNVFTERGNLWTPEPVWRLRWIEKFCAC